MYERITYAYDKLFNNLKQLKYVSKITETALSRVQRPSIPRHGNAIYSQENSERCSSMILRNMGLLLRRKRLSLWIRHQKLRVRAERERRNILSQLIFTARCYASAVLAMGLCPSVCLSVSVSVTSRCSTKTAKRRITQTTPHDTPWTLVFWRQRSPQNSTGVTPYGGTKCRWGGSKLATFEKYRLYLENSKR